MFNVRYQNAALDMVSALKSYNLIGLLGWQDVQQRYRRSAIGPFWLTISMGVMISTIGFVFNTIFKTSISDYLPFLTLGIILWTFISNTVNESCNAFIFSEGLIKQIPLPYAIHTWRVIWRNIIILGHNLILYPIVVIATDSPFSISSLLALPGFMLMVLNLSWLTIMVGLVSARYRDLPQIVAIVVQVIFYLTPIIWMPDLIPERTKLFLLNLNPVFHLIEIVRLPLLGGQPDISSWLILFTLGILGWVVTLLFYDIHRKKIVYWL